MTREPRRRRRFVAPPQHLGPSSDALFATPSTSATPARAEPRAGAAAQEQARRPDSSDVLPTKAAEDTAAAWGESGDDGRDEELLRDLPPHWA